MPAERSRPAPTENVGVDEDLLSLLTVKGKQGPCGFVLAVESLPPPQQAAVTAAVAQGVSPHRLETVFRKMGVPFCTQNTARSHFAGTCRCPKE